MEDHYTIQHVLERYNLNDITLVYRMEEMQRLGLDPGFISALLKLYGEEEYTEDELTGFSLEVIVDYIKRTHHYYLAKRLPEIEQNIALMVTDASGNPEQALMLQQLYRKYKKHLTQHIQAEDEFVLPYIRLILAAKESENGKNDLYPLSKDYSLQSFIENHSDTETELQDLRDNILQFTPSDTNATLHRILLSQMELFEKDLSVHAIIEDSILIPRAIELEKRLIEGK